MKQDAPQINWPISISEFKKLHKSYSDSLKLRFILHTAFTIAIWYSVDWLLQNMGIEGVEAPLIGLLVLAVGIYVIFRSILTHHKKFGLICSSCSKPLLAREANSLFTDGVCIHCDAKLIDFGEQGAAPNLRHR